MEIALLWDKDTLFREYLLDRGITCETVIVMPNTLSAPFFSFTYYKLIIVPAGFGNELYSGMLRMLKVLRANSVLIKDFVNDGGTLLVSGAFSNTDAYNWLPVKIKYVMEKRQVRIEEVKEHKKKFFRTQNLNWAGMHNFHFTFIEQIQSSEY